MSDPTVRETAKRLDDEARAEDRRDKQIAEVKDLIDKFEFELLLEKTEHDFEEWLFDVLLGGGPSSYFHYIAVNNWYETDTLKLAESFVEWIGD